MQAGINQVVDAVRPTLGPRPGVVAFAKFDNKKPPEFLDDGGVIARRIVGLPDRDENVGAMYVRQLLWSVHKRIGDGSATAAVLFHSIYNQGLRYIAAGGDPTLLQRHLESGRKVILDELTDMAVHLEGKEALAQIAESICYDPPLAKMLGEVLDIIGEYGQLEVRSGRSREMEREYVEGMYWKASTFSRRMFDGKVEIRAQMEDAAILITDLSIGSARELVPVVSMAMEAKLPTLMIMAREVADDVVGFLVTNSKPDKFEAVAVKTPGSSKGDIAGTLEDVAVLTGGSPVVKDAGGSLSRAKLEHLGHARRAWADPSHFGIVGGKGDPRALREHIARLRAAYGRTEDPKERKTLRQRIGKLMGGSATLWVGGTAKSEIEARKQVAERTAEALRGVVREGVVPGGGVSLLACRPALQEVLDQSTDLIEQAAYRILINAVEEPIRTIVSNVGCDASEILAEVKHAGPGYGFDARSEQVVDMAQAGIFDAAEVQKVAVGDATRSAALALTVDALVHRKKRESSVYA